MSERDLVTILNGAPMFPQFPGLLSPGALVPGTMSLAPTLANQFPGTGILTSTGTAVNNLTTATPFAQGNLNSDGTRTLLGSMAGRTYLVNAVASGSLMASDSPLIGSTAYWTVALNTTVPPLANTFPGVPLQAGDVRILIMSPNTGWLQWISASGTASLVVTELF